jgi:cell division protein FtsB
MMSYFLKKPIASIGSFLSLGAIVTFFGFHTISGERGLLAQPSLQREIIQAEEKLTLLNKHQKFLERRIGLLRNDFIDADMLAETARSEFGLYGLQEIIIAIDLADL